jgi:hypothetical protein
MMGKTADPKEVLVNLEKVKTGITGCSLQD